MQKLILVVSMAIRYCTVGQRSNYAFFSKMFKGDTQRSKVTRSFVFFLVFQEQPVIPSGKLSD